MSDESVYERWRQKFGHITGLGLTETEAQERDREFKNSKCLEWKRDIFATSPKVVFMLQHLRQLGSNVPQSSVHCVPCQSAGTVHPWTGHIFLCQGTHLNRSHMEDALTHELIHLYDHVRFKVDWDNLRHHACSEIRANNLSGDCSWGREMQRGSLSFTKHHQVCVSTAADVHRLRVRQECVRRRAVVSVRAHPACPDEATAEKVVNEVFESCVKDTRPFDEIY